MDLNNFILPNHVLPKIVKRNLKNVNSISYASTNDGNNKISTYEFNSISVLVIKNLYSRNIMVKIIINNAEYVTINNLDGSFKYTTHNNKIKIIINATHIILTTFTKQQE